MAKKNNTKRAKRGAGSFRKYDNGLYEYRITYRDEFDKPHRKSFCGESQALCIAKAKEFLYKQEMRRFGIDLDITIPQIMKQKYESDLEKNFIGPQGYSRNMATLRIIERHFIGQIPIIELKQSQIDAFLRSITNYSRSVIEKLYSALKRSFEIACESQLITNNLMKSSYLRCPRSNQRPKKVRALTKAEQEKFLEALKEHKIPDGRNGYKLQLLIELYSGMRMGEINALTDDCIDFEQGVIHVRRTISRGAEYEDYIKNGTKTYAGTRDIPINKFLKPVLEEALKQKKRNPWRLVFYDYNKNAFISTSQVNCFYRRLCQKANIRFDGQHALRHTFATRCIEAGIPPVVLKTWLGHTSIKITFDTYTDVFHEYSSEAMSLFESKMTGIY